MSDERPPAFEPKPPYEWKRCPECGERYLGVSGGPTAPRCSDCRGVRGVGGLPSCPKTHIDYHGDGAPDDV